MLECDLAKLIFMCDQNFLDTEMDGMLQKCDKVSAEETDARRDIFNDIMFEILYVEEVLLLDEVFLYFWLKT